MKVPKAHAGVKKLFAVELIQIIIGFVAVLAVIFAATKSEGLLLASGTMLLATGIAAVVAFVLSLVGLHQAGKDEIQIQYAFCMALLGIILGVVASILGGIKNPGKAVAILADIAETGEKLAQLFTSFYVLMGIASLASKLKEAGMEKQGKRLANWVILLYCVSILLGLTGLILKALPSAPEVVVTITAIVAIVAAISELIVYILTVVYYGKAVKMLKK